MTKYKEVKILDIEESEDGNKLVVPFEVPGDKFDQSYPRRLKHTFPKKKRFLQVVDEHSGERRFERIIKDLYLESEADKKERSKADGQLDKVRQECRGKCLNKDNS